MPANLVPEPFSTGGAPALRGESMGEGTPVALCHGITASRGYVVHGSKVLPRAGHRVISYDARGHGESDPAPPGSGYRYSELVSDLGRVADEMIGASSRFVAAGHSMGAHTAVAYALEHPENLDALVVIGPVYLGGAISDSALSYWNGLADALESGGIDGFVEYIGERQGMDPAWKETVARITRERLGVHRHLDALVDALREVPASRPFESLEQLGSLDLPTLVVASRDEADPGHPYAAAEAYAEAIPGARLISEAEGESPLAWQGGRLSREIRSFLAGGSRAD